MSPPPRRGDVNGDGCVDIEDVRVIVAGRGTVPPGIDDPRDLDGDGYITGLDARKAVLLCDVPRCAACGGEPPSADAAERYYVHTDHLGTPKAITDEDQRIVWQAEYTPFGEAVVEEDPDGDGAFLTFNLRFPGQYFDQETGLHYNYFRDYDPRTGRYVESDPIGLRGGLNTYAYVDGNPLKYIDPEGLSSGTGATLMDLLLERIMGITESQKCRDHFCAERAFPSQQEILEFCAENADGDSPLCFKDCTDLIKRDPNYRTNCLDQSSCL